MRRKVVLSLAIVVALVMGGVAGGVYAFAPDTDLSSADASFIGEDSTN